MKTQHLCALRISELDIDLINQPIRIDSHEWKYTDWYVIT